MEGRQSSAEYQCEPSCKCWHGREDWKPRSATCRSPGRRRCDRRKVASRRRAASQDPPTSPTARSAAAPDPPECVLPASMPRQSRIYESAGRHNGGPEIDAFVPEVALVARDVDRQEADVMDGLGEKKFACGARFGRCRRHGQYRERGRDTDHEARKVRTHGQFSSNGCRRRRRAGDDQASRSFAH